MIYLIGGVARSGKSLVRKKILEKYNVAGISLDLIRGAIQRGVPEVGIAKGQANDFRTVKMWPFIQGLLDEFYYFKEDFVIEGVNLDPKKLIKYRNDPNFTICFLGYTSISPEEKFKQLREIDGDFEWTKSVSDHSLLESVKNNIEKSKELQKLCSELQYDFFDTSNHILDEVERIAEALVQKN